MKGSPRSESPQAKPRFVDQRHREDALDEALAESFPASDSPSLARSGAHRWDGGWTSQATKSQGNDTPPLGERS
jgi:hypothetical protein